MTTHTFFMNDDQITLINLSNGNRVTVYRDDRRFDTFKEFISSGEYIAAENMDVKVKMKTFSSRLQFAGDSDFEVKVNDGIGTIILDGQTYPLADAIAKKIVRMCDEGFDAAPLVKFLRNLYKNPSKTAIDEFFLFAESNELPITTDGHFIAYKIVTHEYKDIYTGKMDNSIGKVVSMPRFGVDDNRSRTCSAGLHFCSREYLPHYGSNRRDADRCVLVKIDPADVVSIPVDYNNAKGRTCRYEVIGEVESDKWRADLEDRDYNESAVVDESGNDVVQKLSDREFDVILNKLLSGNVRRCGDGWVHCGYPVSKFFVCAHCDIWENDLMRFEAAVESDELDELDELDESNG